MYGQHSPWTNELANRALKLWGEGLSYGEIAVRFGMTRNTIAGKLNRMGAKKRNGSVSPVTTQKIDKARRSIQFAKLEPGLTDIAAYPNDPSTHDLVTFAALKSDQCKWPIGDQFCGREKLRELAIPYCPAHMRRAHKHS